MGILQIAAFGITAAVLSLTLKKDNPSFSLIIGIAAAVLIFIAILPNLAGVMELVTGISDSIHTDIPFVSVIIKIIGIAYIAEFSAQVINDAGETAIASKVELAGKILIITASAPIIFALVNQVITMFP